MRSNYTVRIGLLLVAFLIAIGITFYLADLTDKLSLGKLVLGEIFIFFIGNFGLSGFKELMLNIHTFSEVEEQEKSAIYIWWRIFFQILAYMLGVFVAISAIPDKLEDKVKENTTESVSKAISEVFNQENIYVYDYSQKYDFCITRKSPKPHHDYLLITFQRSDSILTEEQITHIKKWVTNNQVSKADVGGFASDEPFKDNDGNELKGSHAKNQKLARARAKQVANLLENQNIEVSIVAINYNGNDRSKISQHEGEHSTHYDPHILHRSVRITKQNIQSEIH